MNAKHETETVKIGMRVEPPGRSMGKHKQMVKGETATGMKTKEQ